MDRLIDTDAQICGSGGGGFDGVESVMASRSID